MHSKRRRKREKEKKKNLQKEILKKRTKERFLKELQKCLLFASSLARSLEHFVHTVLLNYKKLAKIENPFHEQTL